jgi:hypothetical protein
MYCNWNGNLHEEKELRRDRQSQVVETGGPDPFFLMVDERATWLLWTLYIATGDFCVESVVIPSCAVPRLCTRRRRSSRQKDKKKENNGFIYIVPLYPNLHIQFTFGLLLFFRQVNFVPWPSIGIWLRSLPSTLLFTGASSVNRSLETSVFEVSFSSNCGREFSSSGCEGVEKGRSNWPLSTSVRI